MFLPRTGGGADFSNFHLPTAGLHAVRPPVAKDPPTIWGQEPAKREEEMTKSYSCAFLKIKGSKQSSLFYVLKPGKTVAIVFYRCLPYCVSGS